MFLLKQHHIFHLRFIYFILFLGMSYLHVCIYTMWVLGTREVQKMSLDPLELELPVVGATGWVRGAEPESPARATTILTTEPSLQQQSFYLIEPGLPCIPALPCPFFTFGFYFPGFLLKDFFKFILFLVKKKSHFSSHTFYVQESLLVSYGFICVVINLVSWILSHIWSGTGY